MALGATVAMHRRTVDLPKGLEIRRPEGMEPRHRSLGDVAGGVDPVVEHHKNAPAARVWSGGGAQGGHEIQSGIAR